MPKAKGWGNIFRRRVRVFTMALVIYLDYKVIFLPGLECFNVAFIKSFLFIFWLDICEGFTAKRKMG